MLRERMGLLEPSEADCSLLRWLLRNRVAIALLVLSLAGSGCTTAWVVERRLAPTGLAPQDAIAVILLSPLGEDQRSKLENQVNGCIRDGLAQTHSDLRFVSPDELRKLASADPAAKEIPPAAFSWQSLLSDPGFNSRIAPLGLRYLIVVNAEEKTRLTDFKWSAASSLLGAPLLEWSWENSTLIEAIVVDARNRRLAGGVQAYAAGKSGAGVKLVFLPIPLPIPYGTPSFPWSAACQGLGEGLARFLTANNPAQEQAVEQSGK